MKNKDLLTTKSAAEYLGVSESTLKKIRTRSDGVNRMPSPPFIQMGKKIMYLRFDLDSWLQKQRVLPSKRKNSPGA